MLNNIVTYKELKCPTKELECILKEVICKYACSANTADVVDVQFNPTTRVLTVTVNGVSDSITIPETLTTLEDLTLTGTVLTLTYKGEDGLVQTKFQDLASLITTVPETTFAGTSTDGSLTITPAGTNGHTPNFKVNFPAPVPDVVTTLTNTVAGHKIGQYNNESGTSVDINETPVQYSNSNSAVLTHEIGVLTNELGGTSPILETIVELLTPTLIGNVLTLSLKNEAGVTQTASINLGGLATIDINLQSASYNASTNIITLTETDSTTHTIDLSEFSIVATTNPDGSIKVVQEGVTKFTIPAPCCISVNKVPLLVAVNPSVVQTSNFNSIVTDVNGDVFFIDAAGNAQKLTTDFVLNVTAGTTNLATDDSLGSAVLNNGDTLHFYSSDGSMLFGVVQGSAETNVRTNSTIIPFTASVPVGNDAGLASTTVQGAIDEVDTKVEILEDKNRAYAKQGTTQATNNQDVLVTDNVFHKGRVTEYATETETPFSSEYAVQIGDKSKNIAHERLYGIDVRDRGFRMAETNDYAITATFIFVDHLNGIDGLEPSAYYGATLAGVPVPATSTTPSSGYKFKTLQAACHWVNRSEEEYVVIQLFNTSATDRHILTADAVIKGKTNVSIIGVTFASKSFLNLSTFRIIGANVRLSLGRLDVVFNSPEPIIAVDGAIIEVLASVYTYPNTANIGLFFPSNGVFHISDRVTFNFGANGQSLFNPKGNYSGKCVMNTHTLSVPTFNVGAFTGIVWSTAGRTFETWFSSSIALSIPSSISMVNTWCRFNQNEAIGVSAFDNLNYNYPLNLGTTKPLRFTDLNSLSPDGTFVTKKKLVVNELGEVILITDTGSTFLGIEEEQISTANQTVFTLPVAPIGLLVGYWGGVKLPKGSVTYLGTTATYNPALNGGLNIPAGEVISFVY